MPHHHAADDVVLSRSDKGLEPGSGHRLSGSRQHRRHDGKCPILEALAILIAIYLAINLSVSAAMNVYNQRVALRGAVRA
ncbi:hypothetical protein [Mesorhizobium sp.]|uniref:hypothetical protein n=1 Tax=Mesorhizobium sp. TaxID=1871066 RepID=UPI0025D29DD2|nr:hypothetical protein [Mesorhizobium sp.]